MVNINKEKVSRKELKGKKHGSYGEVYLRWNFPEYGTHFRTRQWQKWAVIAGFAFFLYALLTSNFLFAVIIVLIATILFFQTIEHPLTVTIQITEDGIVIGKRFYDYRELDKFWIIYEPPHVKNLYIEFRNVLKPRLGIPLQDQNPIEARMVLLKHLPEDTTREHEPLSDSLARFFKLHH